MLPLNIPDGWALRFTELHASSTGEREHWGLRRKGELDTRATCERLQRTPHKVPMGSETPAGSPSHHWLPKSLLGRRPCFCRSAGFGESASLPNSATQLIEFAHQLPRLRPWGDAPAHPCPAPWSHPSCASRQPRHQGEAGGTSK